MVAGLERQRADVGVHLGSFKGKTGPHKCHATDTSEFVKIRAITSQSREFEELLFHT